MSKTRIPWAEEVWNPIRGCSRISTGCENCYAEKMAGRFCGKDKHGKNLPFAGFAHKVNGKARWTGKVKMFENKLMEMLKRKKPTVWFVNSMSDVFHEEIPDSWIDSIYAMMALRPQHTFIILTKRAKRMAEYYQDPKTTNSIANICCETSPRFKTSWFDCVEPKENKMNTWPLPNLILGVSIENQETAEERITWLLKTPAAKRIVSLEPLLEEVDLTRLRTREDRFIHAFTLDYYRGDYANLDIIAGPPSNYGPLDGVIAGCESGNGARPAETDWFRAVRDQCAAAGVPFYLKQMEIDGKIVEIPDLKLDGQEHKQLCWEMG